MLKALTYANQNIRTRWWYLHMGTQIFVLLRKGMLCLRTFLRTSVKNYDKKVRNVLQTNILPNGKIRTFTKKSLRR